jgi:hypothetical protein
MKVNRGPSAPLPGMVLAEDLPRARRAAADAPGSDGDDAAAQAPGSDRGRAAADPALLARRERVAEQLTMLQLELGGLYYEMAIRNHVVLEVLNERAGRLQQLDAELAHVDALIASGGGAGAGICGACQAPYARGAAFCWQCGAALAGDATSADQSRAALAGDTTGPDQSSAARGSDATSPDRSGAVRGSDAADR